MQQVEVDFEVWKALTILRESEQHSYNDVIRKVLGLPDAIVGGGETTSKSTDGGRSFGGRFMPEGTRFRAKYKGAWHEAVVKDGYLVGDDGKNYTSASAAARAVTQTNVNGLSFWETKRPSDGEWRRISLLPRSR